MSQYTSESEFNLDKRVHMTNEIPPYDMYDALNSVVQTDLWKWVLGSTIVDFNLPYSIPRVDEEEKTITYVHDIDSKEVYYKMINGKVSPVYGPRPTDGKNYHLLEEYGVLIPEFDFLLHEVYRYLDNLYPDHPDYTELLTKNEFNDFITAAGAIIDYKPDNKFFESLSESFGLSSYEANREAAMIKIRNLRNESFRRKLYGSKAGYRMLANDIFQNATVFPVATYLPLKRATKKQLQKEMEIANNSYLLGKWNKDNNRKFNKEQFIEYNRKYNRKIDTYSKLYHKKFRLIDLDGSNSSYPAPKNTDIRFFGFALPFYESTLFEYPTGTDTESKLAGAPANTFYDDYFDNTTRYVESINPDRSVIGIKYNAKPNIKGEHIEEVSLSDNEVHSINLTYRTIVPYNKGYIYPRFEDVVPNLTDRQIEGITQFYPFYEGGTGIHPRDDENKSIFSYFYYGNKYTGFTENDIKGIVREVELVNNPLIDNTLLLKPEDTLTFYPTDLEGTRLSSFTVVDEVPINWETAVIKKDEYLSSYLTKGDGKNMASILQVTNFTKGKILIVPSDKITLKRAFSEIIDDDDKYGISIENEYGDDIFLQGGLKVEESLVDDVYQIDSISFRISAIPETKNPQILGILYGSRYYNNKKDIKEYRVLIDAAVENKNYDEQLALDYIYGTDEEYYEADRKIRESGLDYTEFNKYVRKYWDAYNDNERLARNRSNIYENFEATDKDGNTYIKQKSLISLDTPVKCFLQGNVSSIGEKDMVYVTYSSLGKGNIKEISFGNLNVLPIYTYDENSLNIPTYVLEKSIKVGDKNIYYLTNNDKISKHDIKYIYNVDGEEIERINFHKQAYSVLDSYLKSYFSNSYKHGDVNSTIRLMERKDIQIESTIDTSVIGNERIIYFQSDLAKELFKSLSVGDIVKGPSIDSDDNDVFITKIGDNYVNVSHDLQQSGTFVLTYSVKTNTTIDDITNDVNFYKQTLYKNGLYSISNPFEHGLWPSKDYPRVSNALLDSLPDISFYEFYSFKPENPSRRFKSNQTILYENCYYDEIQKNKFNGNPEDYKYLLSDIKFNNELFLELNLNKLLSYKSRNGKTPILMSVDWLDYLENSLVKTSRATDNVNVGVNLMMETDTTGYYTTIPNQSYTDPAIKLKFITLNIGDSPMWKENSVESSDWTVPVYAQIGEGGAGRRNWFRSPDDITYPNIWGYDLYDKIRNKEELDEDSEFIKNNGSLKRVNLYGEGGETKKVDISSVIYQNVENPLFEIPLGEYDTTLKYLPKGSSNTYNNYLTITQASFYAQTFKNLLTFFNAEDEVIKINGNDVTQSNILINFDYSKLKDSNWLPDNEFNYAGEWIPTKKAVEKDGEVCYEIVYPSEPVTNTYYVIPKDVELSSIGDSTNHITKNYTASDILFYKKNGMGEGQWHIKSFQFVSLLGDAYNYTGDDGREVYITPESNKAPDNYFSLAERFLQYFLRTTGIQGEEIGIVNERHYQGLSDYIEALDGLHQGKQVFHNLGKEFYDPITKANEGFLMYFLYISDKHSRGVYSNYMENNSLNIYKGDRVALTIIDGKWYMFKINTKTLLGASVPLSIYERATKSEYDVIAGMNRYAKKDGVDFESTIDNLNSSLKLPRGFITDGSFKFNFTVDPRFISKGYLYEKDGVSINKEEEVSFDITKGSIYYDDENEDFYTFSNLYNPRTSNFNTSDINKIAIKFNEPKYFKNVLNTNCAYQIKNILGDSKEYYTKTPTLSAIKGLNFDVRHLNTGDRILEIKEINLRSLYSKNLEPTLFSNYTELNYLIRGIKKNGDLVLSYYPNASSIMEKVDLSTSLEKFRPVKHEFNEEDGDYTETEVQFPNNTLLFNNVFEYSVPVLHSPTVTKSFINNNLSNGIKVQRDFAYFKNNLIVKGLVNADAPRKIVAPTDDSNLFLNALDSISVGDKIIDGYNINGSFEEHKIKISLTHKGVLLNDIRIKRVNFADEQLIVTTDTGDIYFNDSIELANLNGPVEVSKISVNLKGGEIKEVSFNSRDKVWDIEVSEGDGKTSSLYELPKLSGVLDGSNIELDPIYNSDSKVYIDDGENHTLYGREVDSLSGSETVGDVVYTVNNTDLDYINLKNSVIENIGFKLTEKDGVTVKTNEKVFVKDVAIAKGFLKANRDEEGKLLGYQIEDKDMFNNEPYIVDNIAIVDSKYDGRIPIADAALSRSVIASDKSGRFSAYAKGRDLFIKSPNELVEYDDSEKKYKYSGDLSIESYWKHSKAPIFNDKNFLDITRAVLDDASSVEDLFITSGVTAYTLVKGIKFNEETPNADSTNKDYILINGNPISSDYQAQLDKMKSLLKIYVGEDIEGQPDGSNIMKVQKFLDIIRNPKSKEVTESQPTKVTESVEFFYNNVEKDFVFRLKGFEFISETIRDKSTSTIGTNIQKFIRLDETAHTDIIIPDTGKLNEVGAYATYVYYVDTFIFGNNANKKLALSSNINKIQFTKDGLYLLDELGVAYKINISNLSKVSSIEDPNNWIVSSYPNEYCIKGRINSLEGKAYIKIDDEVFTLIQKDSLATIPIFKPTTSYINDEVILLGGYLMSKNAINKVFTEAYTDPDTGEVNINENQQKALDALKEKSPYDDRTSPAIMYSLNGGLTYNIVNTENIIDTVPTTDIYVNAIKYIDSEFRFYCTSNSGTEAAGNNIYYIPRNEDDEYDFSRASKKTLPIEELSRELSYQNDVDSSTGTDFDSSIKMSDVALSSPTFGNPEPTGTYRLFVTEEASTFEIASPKGMNLEDLSVTNKGLDSITVSKDIVPRGEGFAEVLFSLNTFKDIPSQIDFLNTNSISDFVSPKGELRVTEVTRVTNKNIANRMYSYRELAQFTDDKDELGYPSVSEDTAHKFYEYDISKSEDGKEVYTPRTMKNTFNNDVVLCTVDGKRIIYNDIESNTNSTVNFSNKIYIPDSLLIKASKTKFNSIEEIESNKTLRKTDDILTEIVGLKKSTISEVCFESSEPYVRVSIEDNKILNATERLNNLLFIDDKNDESFVDYLINATGELRFNNTYDDIKNITYYDEDGISRERYVSSVLEDGKGGNKYWFDNKTKVFIVKDRIFLDSEVYLSYSHKGGNFKYTNPNLFSIGNKDAFDLPITGMYISNYGYGGARNNEDLWENILPWNLDKEAFTDEYLKNANGEYIYLVDAAGTEIISKNAESPALVGEHITLNKDIFTSSDKKQVSVRNLYGDEYSQDFYIREKPRVEMYVPFGKIVLSPNNNFSCPLFLIKNSVIVNDKVNPDINFYGIDEDDKPACGDEDLIKDYLEFDISSKNRRFNFKYSSNNSPFSASLVKLKKITSIRIKFRYQEIDYEEFIPVEFNTPEHRTPIVYIDTIARFRKNSNSDTYRYLDFDFEKATPIDSSILKMRFVTEGRRLSFINISNFNDLEKTVQFKSSTIDTISFTINVPNKEIKTLKTDPLAISVGNYIFDVKLPIINVGDIRTYHSNYIYKDDLTGIEIKAKDLEDLEKEKLDADKKYKVHITKENMSHASEGVYDNRLAKFFRDRPNVISVIIDKDVTEIYAHAFDGAEKIERFMVAGDINAIGEYAFNNCRSLFEFRYMDGYDNRLPDSVHIVNRYTFYNCHNLLGMNFSKEITDIEEYAFANCELFEETNISELADLKKIGKFAFYNCKKIENLNFEKSKDELDIQDYAFAGCSGIKDIYIKGAKSIGKYAFQNCCGLYRIYLPESLKSIGAEAFKENTSLLYFVFIGSKDAWKNLNVSFDSIGIDRENVFIEFKSANISEYEKVTLELNPLNFEELEATQILENNNYILNINNEVLKAAESTDVPPELLNFYANGTSLDERLKSIKAYKPSKLTSFIQNHKNIKVVNVLDDVAHMPNYVFKDCSSIIKMTISNNVLTIGKGSLMGCSNLMELNITNGSKIYSINDFAFAGCSKLFRLIVPSTIDLLGVYVFKDCFTAREISINSSLLNTLEIGTFQNCRSLRNIDLPENLSTIKTSALRNCESLKLIKLPKKVDKIEFCAFSGCSELSRLTIPESVKAIEKEILIGCDNLSEIIFGGSREDWNSLVPYPENLGIDEDYVDIYCKEDDIDNISDSIGMFTSRRREKPTLKKALTSQFFLGDELWGYDKITYRQSDIINGNVIIKTYYNKYVLDEVVVPAKIVSDEVRHIPYFLNTINGCVLFYGKELIDLEIIKTKESNPNNVFVSGRKGRVVCRKPKYASFYELLNNEGSVIEGRSLAMTSNNRESLADISLIDKDKSSVVLADMFENVPELNDGNVHFLKMKVLTQKTILTDPSTANNEKSYEELNMKDIEKFTPDRVWYNPTGYPEPPIIIGNVIFNEKNNVDYYNEAYKNGNGYTVYRCNSKGKIIGYELVDSQDTGVIDPDTVDYYNIDESGVITYGAKEFELDKTMTLDRAQITRKPIYQSCKEWYKNEFYLKDHESNPFWQIINISSKFNNTTKTWEQYAKICEYKRASLSMALREVSKDDRYLNITKSVFYRVNDLNIQKYNDRILLDIKNGVIRFLLSLPSEKYKNTQHFIKYGIAADNSFYLDDSNGNPNKRVWTGNSIGLPVYVDSSYTVNSSKNLANPKDRDSDVKAVTELGLFNKYHQLIAYAVFPPIEYRTSSQHLSFTCYVKQGQLTNVENLKI